MKLRSSKTNVASRSRLLALVGGAALVAALVPSAFGADPVDYATVTGYAAGGSDNNHVDTWEKLSGLDCTKTADGANLGDTYLLTSDYELVIVKAGSDASTDFVNTLFADASAGETVWADSNGDGIFNAGDKGISHIIFCGPSEDESESPSASVPPEETAPPSESVPPEESASPSESVPPEESASPSESVPPEESASPSESTPPEESASPSESVPPEESASPSESVPPEESASPSESAPQSFPVPTQFSGPSGSPSDSPSSSPSGSDGGVEGETDTPTAPPTDSIGSSTSQPGGSLRSCLSSSASSASRPRC